MQNLLKKAMSIIPTVRIQYHKSSGTVANEFGQMVNSYGSWTDCDAIVESGLATSAFGSRNIEEASYKDLGLDPSKRTITVWINGVALFSTAGRNTCDQIKYDGAVFNILNSENWLDYNGWKRFYCQEIIPSVGNGGEE